MFKRVFSLSLIVGVCIVTGVCLHEGKQDRWYNKETQNKQEQKVDKVDKKEFVEPSAKTRKELSEGLAEKKKADDAKPSAGEKFSQDYQEWVESPVGTESPYYKEGQQGENPVYDGTLKEQKQKPNRDDKYKDSPFYNPETGKNVVEDGEKAQDKLPEDEAPFIR
ncbi:hypothetical protein UT300012_22640 [Paraclostridium bifermentans]